MIQPPVDKTSQALSQGKSHRLPQLLSQNWESSSDDTGNRQAESRSSAEQCQCLQTMAVLLEELESKGRDIDSIMLDAVLASQKENLTHCNTMLHCKSCTIRSENMLLLVIVCEKMVNLSAKTVDRYQQQSRQLQEPPMKEQQLQQHQQQQPQQQQQQQQKLFFGNYKVDSQLEMDCLLRVLLMLQLKSLTALLFKMKTEASSALRDMHLSMLMVAEKRLMHILLQFKD